MENEEMNVTDVRSAEEPAADDVMYAPAVPPEEPGRPEASEEFLTQRRRSFWPDDFGEL